MNCGLTNGNELYTLFPEEVCRELTLRQQTEIVPAGTLLLEQGTAPIHLMIINEGQVFKEGTPRQIINDAAVRSAYLGNTFRGDEFDAPKPSGRA